MRHGRPPGIVANIPAYKLIDFAGADYGSSEMLEIITLTVEPVFCRTDRLLQRLALDSLVDILLETGGSITPSLQAVP